ncbi:archaetidylserine decarboxylase [Accumulibacter sp.]|uniref:archaetidylserine decarboxylase n=1 Tax=Accumulibacter sp. TaxID=2053492 RepID=UPI002D09434A|nr:archaetidylserine decarboxylase [Accumulibacter sp.]HNC27586.1 archaetidylserine decarboxylase [Accumulibacter sp.]HNH92265.1 archaetidylserine decarboxylase [Accumulibacter sp.]HNI51424.1 archaetidylserine decarboxylase [Accumulibacter sp.]
MSDRIAVLAQHLLPKQALTQLAGRLAASNAGSLTTAVIRWFIGRYDVDMSEAAEPNPVCYPTFNEFFTRALRDGARPLAEADFVCPVDGAISQFGRIERDQIFQAKGHRYSTAALLGGDSERAAAFVDGDFATLYLSPRDYHRIHMPVGGRLRQMLHVPGELFSVNPATARGVAGLFARNERVVCLFDADFGPFVLTLVGATIVGSMATVWHGTVNPPRSGEIRSWTYDDHDRRIELAKGEEMGRFMLGSTVVMLFPRNTLAFNPDWRAARPVRMGEMMAKRTPSGA